MKNFLKISLNLFIVCILVLTPTYSFSANDADFDKNKTTLIPCGRETVPGKIPSNDPKKPDQVTIIVKNPCNADHLIIMINRVLNYILVYLVLPIGAIMFAYAGFLLLFSGGDTHKRSEAKSIFTNVAIGIAFVAGAWLIVNSILTIMGFKGSINFFK